MRAKSQPANKNNWQVMTLVFMTVIMAFDFLFVMMILQEAILGYYFYDFEIPMLPKKIGDVMSFAVLFVGPSLVLNYILIFRNRRYEKLIKEYKYHNGKLAATFMLLGLFIPFIALVFGMINDLI